MTHTVRRNELPHVYDERDRQRAIAARQRIRHLYPDLGEEPEPFRTTAKTVTPREPDPTQR